MSNEVVMAGSRGTPQWAVNRFRSDALSQLLNDLLRREEQGLKPEQCRQVVTALGEVVNVATGFPDGGWFRGAVWKELQLFADIYEKWNSHEGSDPDSIERRKRELRNLRDKRHRIAQRIRKNQHVFDNDLDLRLISDIYGAFGKLSQALPDLFSNLGEAVKRFTDRKD